MNLFMLEINDFDSVEKNSICLICMATITSKISSPTPYGRIGKDFTLF